uniref:Putative secreted protein n=1 Tax=Anopheles darlingi TaxID=43151 RepID=A0A2M4DF71_ANODA
MPIARAMMEGLSLHSLAISCFAHAQRPRRGFTVPRLPKKPRTGEDGVRCDPSPGCSARQGTDFERIQFGQ